MLDEQAATTHTPAGWPVCSIELVPSGRAPKKYGDGVYRFGASITLSVLLPRRGWTLLKQTKNYAYLKPPDGEDGPPFRMLTAVPTDAECLAIAERSFARGRSWLGQLGEWPAYYAHEESRDIREFARDRETGEMRSRILRLPRQSSLTIGEQGALLIRVTGEGGRFAMGPFPPEPVKDGSGSNAAEQAEDEMTAANDDMGADPSDRTGVDDVDADEEWEEWHGWDGLPEEEYTEEELREKGPIRVTLEYAEAKGGSPEERNEGPHARLYAHDAIYDDDMNERLEGRELLAIVTRGGMVTFPLGFNPAHADFLKPRYGKITSISLPAGRHWSVPKTVRRFDEIIAKLPTGFSRYAALGLGLKYEYRLIMNAARRLPGVTELAFVHGGEMRVDGHRLKMGLEKFEQLRKGINTISGRATNQSLEDRIVMVDNEILHRLDPANFPLRQRKLRPGEIYKLAELTSRQPKLSEKDMNGAVEVLSHAAPSIAKVAPEKLLALSADIETIALDELIVRMEAMMQQDLTEASWQAFFMANPFVISLALPYAVFVLGEQAHVGGTKINGVGENIADYLVAQKFTGGLGVIEIKRPSHELVTEKVFRGGVHAPHPKVTSAIAQVLGQKAQLTANFANKAVYDETLRGKHVMNVNCVVIIGITPPSEGQQRSFDLFRDAVKNVSVLTFDELLDRIRDLRRLMSTRPAPSRPDVPSPAAPPSTPQFEPEDDDDNADLF